MSKFTEVLTVSPLPDGKTWIIRGKFGYHVGKERSHEVITVPEGFETDFTSVPRFLWWLFPKWDKYGNAAVIHDYLYWRQNYTRKQADVIFKEGMKVLKVNPVVIFLLYWCVRLFGFIPWWRNAQKKKKGVKKVVHRKRIKNWKYKEEIGEE